MADTGNGAQWLKLASPPPPALADARKQAHYALQFISIFGAAYIGRMEDMGNMSMGWDRAKNTLISKVAMGPRMIRMSLDLGQFEIHAVEPTGALGIMERLNLHGVTLEGAARWMRKTVARFGLDPEIMRFEFGSLPDHPLKEGASFTLEGDEAGIVELSRYLHNADIVLRSTCSDVEDHSSVMVWPENFDLSTVCSFRGGKALGLGMVPGDDYLEDPYFYVNIYPSPPKPPVDRAPELGAWRVNGWTGLILAAPDFINLPTAEGQSWQVEKFFRSAIALLKSV